MRDLAVIGNQDADAELISATGADVELAVRMVNAFYPAFKRQQLSSQDALLFRGVYHDRSLSGI